MSTIRHPIEFIHETRFADLPAEVVAMLGRCCLDTLGVAVAGRATDLSRIIMAHAVQFYGAAQHPADILFTGRVANIIGAALAGGMTIDSFDAHDGHRLTKGHSGAAIVPALLALCSSMARAGRTISGQEFLTALAVGYEVSIRAGIALHATACDYHTSGSWNAVGVAAVAARLWGLDAETTRHALGIAEYHGPRSQMMRCIDHPTMLKDGSGWGAMVGVSSACLAREGFTGAPAVTIESGDVATFWSDLGTRWELLQQYFKPYPVCRWAQPAIQAAQDLMRRSSIDHRRIAKVEIVTFHEGVRLAGHAPRTTEEAQYAIAFPIAAMLVRGKLGPEEIASSGLKDPDVLAVSRCVELIESEEFNRKFPAERWATVTVMLDDGTTLKSPPRAALGDPEWPMTDVQLEEKYFGLCKGRLSRDIAESLRRAVRALPDESQSIADLLDLVRQPVTGQARESRRVDCADAG